MQYWHKRLVAFLGSCCWAGFIAVAQPQYVLRHDVLQKKEQAAVAVRPYLEFSDIGKIVYYHDEARLKNINKLNAERKDEQLMIALEDYISRFGVQNFGTNYEMLWMLGQLYERLGYLDNAKWMYRLILKHSDEDIRYIAQYYDSITRLERDYYVPINYYYELVEFRKQIDTLYPPQGVLINMGEAINSPYEDYGPSLSIDNNTLIFASKRNRIRRGMYEYVNEDVYVSYREGDGWSPAEPLADINTPYNEGTPVLTRNGRTMYFIRCESPEGLGSCDIYEATLNNEGKWGKVRNLGPNVNSPYWESHPSLSRTGDTLYFTSDRPGGFGSNDLYFTFKDKNGKWQPAVNLGPVINTKGSEVSPFHHPEHDVLYFASNGHLFNFGHFDLYKSHRADGKWQEPKNIGPLVNGKGDEYFFTIDSESKSIYYARSEISDIKDLNLYSFPLPMEAQPTATTVFRGVLRDSTTGAPFHGIVSIIDLDRGIEVAPKYLREDGSFEFDLINHNNYLLVIQGEDFFRIEKLIRLESDTVVELKTPSIKSVRMQFASIEFETNSAKVTEDMKPDLDRLVSFLLDNPTMALKISGHTDSKGDPQKNFKLSQDRANAIREYILSKGVLIDPSRVEARGYGSTMPIVKEEKTEEDRRMNRRVEFEIIRQDNRQSRLDILNE